jgi:hypothetical protein
MFVLAPFLKETAELSFLPKPFLLPPLAIDRSERRERGWRGPEKIPPESRR